MEHKARTIKLWKDPFEEELLPHQTLLYIYFIDRGKNLYRWTPRIRGGEVERIFFKMIEVEEKNSPEGVWSDELNKAAEQIPKLKEFKLPVRIKCSRLEETDKEKWRYRVEISILSDEASVRLGATHDGNEFWIDECHLLMTSVQKALFKKARQLSRKLAISQHCNSILSFPDYTPGEGISFYVWLEKGLERTEYQILSRELAGAIRNYIRNVILDFKGIQKGFEEI